MQCGPLLLRRALCRQWRLLSRRLRSLRQVRRLWRLRTDHHCCLPPRHRPQIARLRSFTITITMVIAMCVCARLFKPFYAPSIEGSCTY